MNPKQKVAVIVGALVIAALALYPPTLDTGHRRQNPRELYPSEPYLYRSGHEWVFSGRTLIDHATLYNLQATALALTVAAGVVLREREAAP